MHPNTGRYLPFLILLLTISSIHEGTSLPISNTYIWWTLYLVLLFTFFSYKKAFLRSQSGVSFREIQLFLAWNIICIIRGIFVAENYWEWKNLTSIGMVLLLPASIVLTGNPAILQNIIRFWIRYALPAIFLFIPFFVNPDSYGRYLVPIAFLLLFFPVLSNKWKFISLAFTLLIIFGAPDARSNIIKFSVAFVFGLLYYLGPKFQFRLFKYSRVALFSLPIILFVLALSGVFNIFKLNEYLQGEYKTTVVEKGGEVREADLMVDTRTFIYEEVVTSAVRNNYVFLGNTPARGYESDWFGTHSYDELRTGKMERFASEVSLLNIFTWTGLVGVILYFLIFLKSTYLALYRSNNTFIRILGLYVSFRWFYAWVEDFSNFDLSYMFLWLIIGMCFSKTFREMDDLEIKQWIRGMFYKKATVYSRLSFR